MQLLNMEYLFNTVCPCQDIFYKGKFKNETVAYFENKKSDLSNNALVWKSLQ